VQTRSRDVVCFLTEDFDLWELAGALSVFTHVGRKWNWRAFRVHLVADAPGSVRCNLQAALGPVSPLGSQTRADVVLLPGGYGCRRAAQQPALLEAIAALTRTAEAVLACSTGTLLLAESGLLRGARVACSAELGGELLRLESSLVRSELPVEVHGKLTTAAQGVGAPEAALRVVAQLLGQGLSGQAAAALGLPEPLTLQPIPALDSD
jgi:transcriptional regulator GlxA family with amidase domain